ncbi:type II toxin-antitoxin system CcdA family antitoxin [soil metagenome]
MRMARVNVYLPDELARAAKDADLNVSSLTQEAVRRALAARATNDWLNETLERMPDSGISHDQAMAALDAAREGFGRQDD